MPVNYYANEYGVISVIVGDEDYAAIRQLSTGNITLIDRWGSRTQAFTDVRPVIHADDISGIVQILETATIEDDVWNRTLQCFPKIVQKPIAQPASTTPEILYTPMEEDENKTVWISNKINSITTTHIDSASRFEMGGQEYHTGNSQCPYGMFGWSSGNAVRANYVYLQVLFCDSAFNNWGLISIITGSNALYSVQVSWSDINSTTSKQFLHDYFYNLQPDTDYDPYDPGGNTGDDDTPGEGGDGDFTDNEDPIPIPDLPDETDVSAANSRFITLFSPTKSQMDALADYMWGNNFDLDTFKKLFANPMDCILGLSIVPFQPITNGSGNVTVGNIETGVSMTKCKQYKEVDCGTINIEKFWGAYLDYSPFTKCEIYLPFIGMRPLNIDDIMGKSVHVVYHIDVLSGACIAYVKCGNAVLYNFIGQCSQSIPVTSNDFTNVVNGALGIAGAIGSMVATGGASAPYAVGAIANSAINALKPNIERSGALSGGASMMEIRKPYLVLTRPKQARATDQNKYMGLPTWITRTLSSVKGYTKVEHVKLGNTHATEEEQKEIVSLLKEGVFL